MFDPGLDDYEVVVGRDRLDGSDGGTGGGSPGRKANPVSERVRLSVPKADEQRGAIQLNPSTCRASS